ncbi:MAG: hypothetical protein SOZ51_01980 [Eubacteriales bacterium]|nr:hypothetical protein [Eubacteriales bacterium]
MKRFQLLAALVALCMLLTLASCATPDTPTPGTSGTSATETPDTPTKPNPEVPTSAPTEESTKPQEPTTAGGNEEEPPKPPKYAWATQGGDGSAESPLIINQENFVAFYNFYLQGGWNSFGDINEHFALGSDIVVNTGDAKTWGTTAPQTVFEKAMCAFNGQLDGKGHSISGLCIKVSGDRAALFHQINKGSTVKNLRVVNSYIELNAGSAGFVTSGTFAGRLHGNIEGCYSDAVVVGIGGSAKTNSLGGIVGMVNENGATVKGCVFAGSVTSENAGAGGIVGKINGGKTGVVISDCLNLGDVKTGFTRSGGILGENSNNDEPANKIINCINLSKNIVSEATAEGGKVGGEVYGDTYARIFKLTVNTYVISDVRVTGGTVANGVTLDGNGAVVNDEKGIGWTFRIVTLKAFLAGGENMPEGWFTAEGCLPCPIEGLRIALAPYLTLWGVTLA